MDYKDKVVLITGASSGIGLAAAYGFARKGAKLMLCARREAPLQEACQKISALGAQCHYAVTDVANEDDVNLLIDKTMAHYGRLDVLVNNAGYGHFLPISETTSQQMQELMQVNFFGTFYATKAVLPIMRKQQSGHIIMVSSVAGKRVFRKIGGPYNVSKFAMQGFTEALRMELRDTSIKVSSVCPVTTATEFFDFSEKQTGKKAKLTGPIQTAEQVADVIVDLVAHPRAEVIMVKSLRLIFALQALFPGFVDWLVAKIVK